MYRHGKYGEAISVDICSRLKYIYSSRFNFDFLNALPRKSEFVAKMTLEETDTLARFLVPDKRMYVHFNQRMDEKIR
jgi:hypothetical protein